MSEHAHQHKSHKKFYIFIFIVLAVLTLVEVLVPSMKIEHRIIAALLTLLAIVKAFLVAYFFMHLGEETRWLKFIAAIPISAALYTIMVVVETLNR